MIFFAGLCHFVVSFVLRYEQQSKQINLVHYALPGGSISSSVVRF